MIFSRIRRRRRQRWGAERASMQWVCWTRFQSVAPVSRPASQCTGACAHTRSRCRVASWMRRPASGSWRLSGWSRASTTFSAPPSPQNCAKRSHWSASSTPTTSSLPTSYARCSVWSHLVSSRINFHTFRLHRLLYWCVLLCHVITVSVKLLSC